MSHIYIKRSTIFRVLGCFISFVLTLPIIRDVVFRDSNSLNILEEITTDSFAFSGDFVNVLATLTLVVPYFIDVYVFRPLTIADYSITILVLNLIIINWFFDQVIISNSINV